MRAIEERGIEPVAVAGCSMGGIVGAFVANKVPSEKIRAAFADLKAISLFDWSSKAGVIGGRGLEKQIERHLPHRFDELKLPFRATAVDVQDGRVYVFSEGELAPALRATSAVPGIFSPVEHDGRVLVDGGLLTQRADRGSTRDDREPIIAVDVTPPADRALIFERQPAFLERLHAPFQSGHRPLFIDLLIKAYEIPAAVLERNAHRRAATADIHQAPIGSESQTGRLQAYG